MRKEVQLRVRVDADMAGRIARMSRDSDVPMSHLVRQALEVAFGNGRGPGEPTPRAPSAKAGKVLVSGSPGDMVKVPPGIALDDVVVHVHRWGKRSQVTALKKCLDCPAVQA